MNLIILFICNIVFNAVANVLIKLGMTNTADLNFGETSILIKYMIFNPKLILGCVFYALSLVFYSFILQKMDLSIAYPIVISGSVFLVMIFSKLIFKESINITQIIGTVIVLLGIVFLLK